MEEIASDSTNRLLRVIVALLIGRKDESVRPLKEQILILHNLGMRPFEIAGVLGKSSSHINKELSGLRKKRKREQ